MALVQSATNAHFANKIRHKMIHNYSFYVKKFTFLFEGIDKQNYNDIIVIKNYGDLSVIKLFSLIKVVQK